MNDPDKLDRISNDISKNYLEVFEGITAIDKELSEDAKADYFEDRYKYIYELKSESDEKYKPLIVFCGSIFFMQYQKYISNHKTNPFLAWMTVMQDPKQIDSTVADPNQLTKLLKLEPNHKNKLPEILSYLNLKSQKAQAILNEPYIKEIYPNLESEALAIKRKLIPATLTQDISDKVLSFLSVSDFTEATEKAEEKVKALMLVEDIIGSMREKDITFLKNFPKFARIVKNIYEAKSFEDISPETLEYLRINKNYIDPIVNILFRQNPQLVAEILEAVESSVLANIIMTNFPSISEASKRKVLKHYDKDHLDAFTYSSKQNKDNLNIANTEIRTREILDSVSSVDEKSRETIASKLYEDAINEAKKGTPVRENIFWNVFTQLSQRLPNGDVKDIFAKYRGEVRNQFATILPLMEINKICNSDSKEKQKSATIHDIAESLWENPEKFSAVYSQLTSEIAKNVFKKVQKQKQNQKQDQKQAPLKRLNSENDNYSNNYNEIPQKKITQKEISEEVKKTCNDLEKLWDLEKNFSEQMRKDGTKGIADKLKDDVVAEMKKGTPDSENVYCLILKEVLKELPDGTAKNIFEECDKEIEEEHMTSEYVQQISEICSSSKTDKKQKAEILDLATMLTKNPKIFQKISSQLTAKIAKKVFKKTQKQLPLAKTANTKNKQHKTKTKIKTKTK